MSLLGVSPVLAVAAWGAVPRPRRKPGFGNGNTLPIVVLDAGHGGRDPGAIGLHGTYEKVVTLDIVQEMADRLDGVARVTLTRDQDRFLALPERVARARQIQANLFISIHADSAPDPAAQGLSVYTLSDTASDAFADKLAAGENIVDQRYGADVKGNEAVADILYDLTARQTVGASRFAKNELIAGVRRDIRLLDQPKRAANFAVLRAPDVPSLLIETGFLSNPADEAILSDDRQRRKIAAVLAREVGRLLKNPLFDD